MRYVVIKKENSSPEAIIWSKSQHQIPVKQGITRECSHRDYLRKNKIPFADVSSIGMVYCNPQNGQQEISVLPWDTPAPPADSTLVLNEVNNFCKQYPELSDEILKDWLDYQNWKEQSRALLDRLKRE